MATRGIAVAALVSVPIFIAASFGFAGGIGGLTVGLQSLLGGPSPDSVAAAPQEPVDLELASTELIAAGGVDPTPQLKRGPQPPSPACVGCPTTRNERPGCPDSGCVTLPPSPCPSGSVSGVDSTPHPCAAGPIRELTPILEQSPAVGGANGTLEQFGRALNDILEKQVQSGR